KQTVTITGKKYSKLLWACLKFTNLLIFRDRTDSTTKLFAGRAIRKNRVVRRALLGDTWAGAGPIARPRCFYSQFPIPEALTGRTTGGEGLGFTLRRRQICSLWCKRGSTR